MIELSMDNPLLANAILEKENKENKTMSKEQKCIAKWIDKDGNTINFERFSTNNIKKIENDCIEFNADTLIASKDTLSNFDYFKVFETEPDGTNEKLMLTIPAHLYLEKVANFYKKKHEHFPYEDEFDAARWKNITDKRAERMGITELTPEKYMELYNNSINKKERVSMDLDSAKAVLDSCAEDFGLKLKKNNIISINGTYPSMQEIIPSEILRASIMGREQKASINLEARVSVIWDSLGITGNGKEYIFNKYLEKLNELYRTDNKLEKFGFNTIDSTDKIQQVRDLTTWALEKHPEVFMTRGKEGADKYNASYPDTLIDIFTMGDYLKDKESELNLNRKDVKYSYFVKDTAEFEQFADFEPIPDLNAKEAVGTMFEQVRKGLSAGIGIHIPDDFIFNDPYGEGAIIFSKVNGTYSFYMGDNFVKELKKNDEHARNVINAFKELDEAIRGFHLNQGLYKEPDFLYIKEKELFGDNTEEFKVTKEEILQERAEIGKRIQHLKDILNNPDPNNPDDTIFVSETKENIERLEKLSEEEIKSLILWKKQNQKNNEDLHKEVVEEMKRERKEQYTVKEGNLFSDNELKTVYKVTNKDTGRSVTIQPSGNIEENIKNLGRLKNLTEAQNIIEKIKSMGFNIYSTQERVILFNDDKFYDFNKYADSGKWNYRTEDFEFNTDRRNLNDWDFKSFIDGGLKITKEMKEFEKMKTVKEKNISFVYQDGDKESRYAFAIDYAQKHNLPCFLIDNEISRKVANDVDFVVFCKDYEDIITKVKSLSEEKSFSMNTQENQNDILKQCNAIFEKYTNTHFTSLEEKYINECENEETNRQQALMSLCNMKYVHCTTKDKNGYWEINKGKEITANEARKLMSYDDFASGVDRASFHITAGRTANDGSFIYFNDGDRKRDIQPYVLTKEDVELLSHYEEAGGSKENIPEAILQELSKTSINNHNLYNLTEFKWNLSEKDSETLKSMKDWAEFYEKSFSDIELSVTDKNNEKHSYIIQIGSGTSSSELEFVFWNRETKLKRDDKELGTKQRMQLYPLGYSYIKTSEVPDDSIESFEKFCKEHINSLLDETGVFIDASLENSKLVEFNGKPKILEGVTASELLNDITIKTDEHAESHNDEKQTNSLELTDNDLKNARALLPREQYQLVLSYTQGEEGEHFKGIIKEISSKAEAIKGKSEILTEDEKHPLAFKYTVGNSRFYFSEWDGGDELFGYVVLKGDTQNSEWGFTSLEELKNAGGRDSNGFPVLPEMTFYGLEETIEKQISIDYPELSEKMGFSHKKNHNEELISEFGKEILETLDNRKLEHSAYNICCAAQFVLRSMDSSERKEVFSIMEKCGCQGKYIKENTEDFLTEVINAESKTASAVYSRNKLYERINKACSTKKTEANKGIQNPDPESDYDMEI